MESIAKDFKIKFPGLIQVFNDGTVERLSSSAFVPPTPRDPETGVSSKDVSLSPHTNLSARLYLPNNYLTTKNHHQNLPILVYFHAGGFCVTSVFTAISHRYMNILALEAQVMIVSVEYRLAPEHPLPAAYEDCWTALNWTTSLTDPWLANYGDLEAVFIGGDSAGGNIVHNIALKADGTQSLAKNREVKILGAFFSHPYFLDKKDDPRLDTLYKIWDFVYPNVPGGSESYMINPMGVGAPSLSGLGCGRVLVVVAEKDELRDGGVRYYDAVKKSGFEGIVELFEVKGEGHCFHASNPNTNNAKLVFKSLAAFLTK